MGLAVKKGDTAVFTIEGPDEEEAAALSSSLWRRTCKALKKAYPGRL